MARSREVALSLVLAVIGLAFAAFTIEAGVRMLHLEPDRFWEVDPLLGSRHVAGRSGWWTQEEREFTVPIQISEQGWRDVPHAVEKQPGVFRILVLGDSFTEAMQVAIEESFPRVLEAELNRRARRRVEVINTGVSGFGTAGQLLLLRRDGERYRPDLVLLAFYPGNDIMNNSPQLEKTLIPVYSADGALERIRAAKKGSRPLHGWSALMAHSKAYRYVRRTLLSGHPDLAKTLARWGVIKAKAVEQVPQLDGIPTAYYVYAPPDATWNAAWEHTARLLDELNEETRHLGARLVVAIVSSRDEVYPDWWQEVQQTYPKMKDHHWDVDGPRRRVASLCQGKGIPYLELTPIMRAAGNGERLHFHYDGHWTPAGHLLAGKAIATYLLEHDLISDRTEEQHALH